MKSVLIWDWPLRIFHWLLVICIVMAYGTAEYGWLDMQWHFYFGYAILVLLGFRLLWGFFGTQHARFVNFLTGPKAVLRYLQHGESRPGEVPAGHSPVGAIASVILLLAVAVQAMSGLFNSDDVQWFGPLSERVSSDVRELAADIHERFPLVLQILIAIHVSAALFYWLVRKNNLIQAMLTGRKANLPQTIAEQSQISGHRFGVALVCLVIAAAAFWALLQYFPGAEVATY